MAKDKVISLVEALVRSDRDKELEWKKALKKAGFTVSFPQYSITLIQDQDEGEFGQEDFWALEIYNELGQLIDRYTDWQLKQMGLEFASSILRQLYESARRQAMGVDAALDSVLAELSKKTK